MERHLSSDPPLSVRPARCDGRAVSRNWDMLVRVVATSFALPPADLMSPSRNSARAAFARQVAMYLAHVSFGATFSAVGRAFGRDRTTAAHAVRVIEERRDDPSIDALLNRLECTCAGMASAAPGAETGAR